MVLRKSGTLLPYYSSHKVHWPGISPTCIEVRPGTSLHFKVSLTCREVHRPGISPNLKVGILHGTSPHLKVSPTCREVHRPGISLHLKVRILHGTSLHLKVFPTCSKVFGVGISPCFKVFMTRGVDETLKTQSIWNGSIFLGSQQTKTRPKISRITWCVSRIFSFGNIMNRPKTTSKSL